MWPSLPFTLQWPHTPMGKWEFLTLHWLLDRFKVYWKEKYSNKLSMKAREGWKYVLVDCTFRTQTVSEWVLQQIIFRSSCLLLSQQVNELGSWEDLFSRVLFVGISQLMHFICDWNCYDLHFAMLEKAKAFQSSKSCNFFWRLIFLTCLLNFSHFKTRAS